ncbi:MAG: DNA mismatch repair protein MutS [Thermomicrobiales bacterium]|nr:DNA mismatch repair protein MutS [Thermomicrobiales bacterium]
MSERNPSVRSTAGDAVAGERVVPLRRQYLDIKQRYPDVLLFFRLGDFYETFENDAIVAAEVLDIVLTSREMGKGTRVPMAGIPYHAAEGYIGRLIAAGHKVAVCEQIGDPAKSKGLVERDVTRVVTPGTVTDASMLDANRNNFIAAVVLDHTRAGIAAADITTGEFIATEIAADSEDACLLATGRELTRLGAVELVHSDRMADDRAIPEHLWLPAGLTMSPIDDWHWRSDRATETLERHFGVASLDGFGLASWPLATRAAGGLLRYLSDTQRSQLAQIQTLATYRVDGFMPLDDQTRRNLELTESGRGERKHSLLAVLDQTRTAMGGRLLRRWLGQPLLDREPIEARLDGVERFTRDALARGELRQALRSIGDIERLVNRAITGTIGPRELATLRGALQAIPDLRQIVADIPGVETLPEVADVAIMLDRAITDEPPAVLGRGESIRPGFSPELDGHRVRAREAREWIAGLERTERERTGIRTLKTGYNKVFGYYLEITAAALATAERDRAQAGRPGSALPDDYIPKQTLANATRYFTPQLKEYETIVLTAEETLAGIEADAYRRVVGEVAGTANRLLETARIVARLDVLSTLAEVAIERSYVRPTLNDSTRIEIERGRHPTIEALLGPGEFVPNGALLDAESDQIIILTGPNMAGKSSWLRQVALIVLMAQIGSFVPADRATIGLVDRIFTRIGAQDDIASGQSTFMIEMLETANILNHATSRSLVVLDEIGRGTSTYDGLAIARAVVEYIHNAPRLGCNTLFATHYHELTELAEILPRVRTYRMDVLEEGDRVVFLRQVVPGSADRSYGIHVAELAGIPKAIVRRATEVLLELEANATGFGERDHRRAAVRRAAPEPATSVQLTMFGEENPALTELKALDVESLTPIEALTKLFELQKRAGR